MLTRILYSIHMPLFFFLSGMSMSPKPLKTREERHLFFRKMILTLVIPYLLWALIYSDFSFPNTGWILYGSRVSLGKAGSVTSLWFLSCLFCARILVQGIFTFFSHTKYGSQRPVYIFPAAVCLILGALFPHREIGYPWCVDIAFVASACILLGVALRDSMIRLSVQKAWVLASLLAGCVLLYSFLVYRLGDNFVILLMCENSYGNPIYAFVCPAGNTSDSFSRIPDQIHFSGARLITSKFCSPSFFFICPACFIRQTDMKYELALSARLALTGRLT